MSSGYRSRLVRRAGRCEAAVIKRLVHSVHSIDGVVDRDAGVGKPHARGDRGFAAVGDDGGRSDRIPICDHVLSFQTNHWKKYRCEEQ